jgi:general secretion pathway protein D
VLKLMDSFATKAGMVRADATRNILLIQGSGAERRAAVDTVLSFDVDWMRGQSVGIYPIANSGPEPIIAELEKIMDSGESGLSQNVVKFQPVSRLNAIMVVSRKPALLRAAATWIRRLDHADPGRTSVHVYHVKYGEARQIARVLTEMFVGGSSSASLDTASGQIAPGSGISSASSSDRLSLNGNNSGSSSSGFGSRSQGGPGMNGASGFGATPSAAPAALGSSSSDAGTAGACGKPVLQGVRITADAVTTRCSSMRIKKTTASSHRHCSRSINRSCRLRSMRPSQRSPSTTS